MSESHTLTDSLKMNQHLIIRNYFDLNYFKILGLDSDINV